MARTGTRASCPRKPQLSAISPHPSHAFGEAFFLHAQEKGRKRRAPLKRRGGCFSANSPCGGSGRFCPADLWGVFGRWCWREPRGKVPSLRPEGGGGEMREGAHDNRFKIPGYPLSGETLPGRAPPGCRHPHLSSVPSVQAPAGPTSLSSTTLPESEPRPRCIPGV